MNEPELIAPLLTAEVVTARLRKLAQLSASATSTPARIDMSASAVTMRLLECAEISALASELAKAGMHLR